MSASVPELIRIDTNALDALRSLLPTLGDERSGGKSEDDSRSESSASCYYSCAGSSPGATPRASPQWGRRDLVRAEFPAAPCAAPDDGSLATEVPSLVEALASTADDGATAAALVDLVGLLDTCYGDAASGVCALMCAHGAIDRLVPLLEPSGSPAVHHGALVLLGNLCSSDVDAVGARNARRLLRQASGFVPLLSLMLDSEDYHTRVYALGAVQNVCGEIDYVYEMQQRGAVERLQALVASGDANLEPYARGTLINMRETILRAAAERRMQRESHEGRWP